MKNTYQLIGVFWDRRPESESSTELVDFDPLYLEAGEPECLFDCLGKRRYVTVSALLSLSSQQDVERLVSLLRDCTHIAMVNDCDTSNLGGVFDAFFQHRIRQAMHLLEDMLPGITVIVMKSPNLELIA